MGQVVENPVGPRRAIVKRPRDARSARTSSAPGSATDGGVAAGAAASGSAVGAAGSISVATVLPEERPPPKGGKSTPAARAAFAPARAPAPAPADDSEDPATEEQSKLLQQKAEQLMCKDEDGAFRDLELFTTISSQHGLSNRDFPLDGVELLTPCWCVSRNGCMLSTVFY